MLLSSFSAKQLCFPPIAGQTIRADCEGGALSSDFGALLLRGIARQLGLTERFAAARHAKRHPSSLDHPLRDLLAQRISHSASGDADGNDANRLRPDPLCTLRVARSPLHPEHDVASAPTCARREHRVDRTDLSRLTQALVDHCIASDPAPPAAIVLDVDHADAPTHGQQALTFYTHDSQHSCSLPLCMFAGPSHAGIMASLRPGTRPPGAENAMLVSRLLSSLRRHWPQTHILVRGDRHGATPEVIEVIAHWRLTDGVFGLAGNAVLLRHAAPVMQEARPLPQQRTALAHAPGPRPPASTCLYAECLSGAASWSHAWRVVLKAAVMPAGDNPRVVVTSLQAPSPPMRSADLSCARGTGANALKAGTGDRHSDRPSATTFLAHALRLRLACAASVLHHALRTHTLHHTALATAQPSTRMVTLCNVAPQGKPYTDRSLLHLPTSCPVTGLLQRGPALLALVPVPALHTS